MSNSALNLHLPRREVNSDSGRKSPRRANQQSRQKSNTVYTDESISADSEPGLHGPHYKCVAATRPDIPSPDDDATTGARCGARRHPIQETEDDFPELSRYSQHIRDSNPRFRTEDVNRLPSYGTELHTMSLIDMDISPDEEERLPIPLHERYDEDLLRGRNQSEKRKHKLWDCEGITNDKRLQANPDDFQGRNTVPKYFTDPTKGIARMKPVVREKLMPDISMELNELRQFMSQMQLNFEELRSSPKAARNDFGIGNTKTVLHESNGSSSEFDQSGDLFDERKMRTNRVVGTPLVTRKGEEKKNFRSDNLLRLGARKLGNLLGRSPIESTTEDTSDDERTLSYQNVTSRSRYGKKEAAKQFREKQRKDVEETRKLMAENCQRKSPGSEMAGLSRLSWNPTRLDHNGRFGDRQEEKPQSRVGRKRQDFIKLEKYDGSSPLETFLVHLNTCSGYNGWNEDEKLAQLKAALRGPAAQVLLSDKSTLTFENVVSDLKDNFGTDGMEAQFESQLRLRRRRKGEDLRSLYQDIHRLILQAYPNSKGRLRDKLAMEAFIDGLNDSDLALKVRNLCPNDLQSAYKTALMLESNQLIVTRNEEPREKKKEYRSDIQARSVTEIPDDQLSERIRVLEGKMSSQNITAPAKNSPDETRATDQMQILKSQVSELEASIRGLQKKLMKGETEVRNQNADWAKERGTGKFPRAEGVRFTGHQPSNSEERRPKNVVCYNCNKPGHRSSECLQTDCPNCHQGDHTLRDCPNYEQHRRQRLCFSCGEEGHFSRACPHSDRSREYQHTSKKASGFSAMKLACRTKREMKTHNVYLQMKLDGVNRSFLLDSGCGMTLIPAHLVNGYPIQRTNKTVHAANGASITLRGEVKVNLQLGNLVIPTDALVSEFVTEGMIGYDWLVDNDCYWGFKTGQIMIRDQVFPLQGRESDLSCCRILVQEDVVVPKLSETIVLTRAVFGRVQGSDSEERIEFATAPKELSNGLYVARAIIPHQCESIPMRVLNSSNRRVVLRKGSQLSDLEPVTVIQESEVGDAGSEDSSWKSKLVQEVDVEVSGREKLELEKILEDYSDCFSKSEFDLGRTALVKHQIETGNAAPIRQALRRQPITYLSEIDRQLDDMRKQGIVEPSASPWASNIVVVAKKDGSLRMCIDYRGVNNVTRKDSYPLPRITDCLDALGSATYFSTFDLRSGYFQIAMEDEAKDKTSFVTRRGSFRFTSMPFGLCNAPATFQRLMDVVMTGLNYEICLVYLDDIILFSHTISEHLVRLRQLLDRLRRANLKLKPSKCHLLRKSVMFLGHVISEGSVATDPEKINHVRNWPTPKDVTEVRSFVGLCSYYRRFIKDFAYIAAPLHALTGKHVKFQWTVDCQGAFSELKRRLVSSPILAMPSDEGEYRLDTDASNYAIGSVLSQVQNGEEKVIAYASRMLAGPEKNYCVTRKELLAIVFFTKQFRPYLLGQEFLIRTDHSALQWLKHTPEPIGQQARWLERLEEFSYRIEHRPGRRHGNADALSRLPCRQCHRTDPEEESGGKPPVPNELAARMVRFGELAEESEWTSEHMSEAYDADEELSEIYHLLRENEEQVPWGTVIRSSQVTKIYWKQWTRLRVIDGVLYRRWDPVNGSPHHYQLIPPKSYRERFLKEAHTGITGGHLGVRKTRIQLQRRTYWHGWMSDVEQFVKRCSECSTYHRGKPKKQGLLQVTEVGEPFERISIDLTGPHPTSRSGNMYILTVIDLFTKWAEAIPLRNKEAATVARALFDVVISRFGIPLQLLSDNGKEFENSLLSELCRLLNIDKLRTTAYRPSANGGIERFHRTLNAMLAKVVSDCQRDWDEHLPSVMAAYRASSHAATGYSPNYLMLGKENRAPIDLLFGAPEDDEEHYDSYDGYASERVNRMRKSYDMVRQHLGRGAERMKKYYDLRVRPSVFNVNTWVYYYNPRRYTGKSPKWQRMYEGPYLITKMLGAVNAVIQKSKRSRGIVTHIDKLKPCYGLTPTSWLSEEGICLDPDEREAEKEDAFGKNRVLPERNDEICLTINRPQLESEEGDLIDLDDPIEVPNNKDSSIQLDPGEQLGSPREDVIRGRPPRVRRRPSQLSEYVC
jgi:transposase InsO family protein